MLPDDEDDEEPTTAELAEARALARALEPTPGTTAAERGAEPGPQAGAEAGPDDALQTAALLRAHAADWSPARQAAVWRRVEEARPAATGATRAGRPDWSRRLAVGGVLTLLGAASAALLLLIGPSARPGPTSLPSPEPALLQAQLRLLGGETAAAAEVEGGLRRHRLAVYDALALAYGERR